MLTRSLARISLVSLVCLAGGCKADDDGDGGDDGDTNAAESGTEESGGESFACGDLDCAADQACLSFPQAPMCETKPEDQPCPDGTSETLCGGAGIPCCCGPTPPTVYECAATTACGDVVDCSCLAEVCVPQCWATADALVFVCEEGPAP